MAPTIVVSLVSLTVSIVSTVIAVASFRRNRQIQEYDYATRLQIAQEEISAGGQRNGDVFSYSAELVNFGLKPVEIDRVYIDYGGGTLDKTWHFVLEGNSHISPGGKRRIDFSLSEEDYLATLVEFGLQQCLFRLRVRHLNMTGGIVETQRRLIAIGPGSVMFYVQRGDALS